MGHGPEKRYENGPKNPVHLKNPGPKGNPPFLPPLGGPANTSITSTAVANGVVLSGFSYGNIEMLL